MTKKRKLAIIAAILAVCAIAVGFQALSNYPISGTGAITANHCASWNQQGVIQDSGGICGTGSGNTTSTGTGTGNFGVYTGAATLGPFDTSAAAVGDLMVCTHVTATTCDTWAVVAGNASGTKVLQETSAGAASFVTAPIAAGGTGSTTAGAALIALFPTASEVGDLVYCSAFSSGNCTAWSLLAGNTSGTALLQETSAGAASWVTALTNGITATTQGGFSNDTKVGTDAYADNNFKGVSVTGFRDDFLGMQAAASVTTINTLSGDTTWSTIKIGTDACAVANVAGTFANPGQYSLTSGSGTIGDGCVIFKNTGTADIGALGSNAGWEINFIAKIGATTNLAMRIGACVAAGQAADPPTDGMYVEYDTTNTGNTNTDFTWVTRSGSASNYSTTNAIAADTNFHHFKIRSTVSGTILFSVDGGSEASVATDVTSAALLPFIQIIDRTGAGAKVLTIDLYSYMASTGRT